MNEIITTSPDSLTSPNPLLQLVGEVCAMLGSKTSIRLYSSQLTRFLNWVSRSGNEPLSRSLVAAYLAAERESGKTPSSLRLAKAAIMRLAAEAEVRGLISERELQGIRNIELPRSSGARLGNWLSLADAKRLRELPNPQTIAGKRDRAVFALLLGCGLRREEAASLTWDQYQTREGRQIFADILGKGHRLRSLPVPAWAAAELDIWRAEIARLDPNYGSNGERCYVLRRIQRDWKVVRVPPTPSASPILGPGLTAMGVWWIVKSYSEELGVEIRPHDLRRTLASLMEERGVNLLQIQLTLGHANLRTTERYLGQLKIGPGLAGVDQVAL
jgi:site-specific recombinase XerD